VEALEKPGGSLEDIYLLIVSIQILNGFLAMLDFWHTQKRQQHFGKGMGETQQAGREMTMPDIGVADYGEFEVQ
jgi:hypothetical protein